MAEEVIAPEQVVEAPAPQQDALPPMTPDMRAAFANPTEPAPRAVQDLPPVDAAPAATGTEAAPVTPAAPAPVAAAPDYTGLLTELGVESVDALKEKWNAAKDYDPKTVEQLRANQRDAHDEALRTMVATDPTKARAYFDLQALPVDTLVTGTPDEQRELLFTQFKLANPTMPAKLAQLEFEDEFALKYGLADSDETDDPAVVRAKERLNYALSQAAPVVKAAQEAAKIALVPKPEAANQPTPEQQQAADAAWLQGVTAVLAQPKIEQVFQTENGPVKVGYDTQDAELKTFLDKPLGAVEAYLNKVAYPNGFDKPADMAALAQAYLRLTKPEAIAQAAAAVGKASVGAHVPMEKLVNPAAPAPLVPAGGGEDQAGAIAAIRAVAQGRR